MEMNRRQSFRPLFTTLFGLMGAVAGAGAGSTIEKPKPHKKTNSRNNQAEKINQKPKETTENYSPKSPDPKTNLDKVATKNTYIAEGAIGGGLTCGFSGAGFDLSNYLEANDSNPFNLDSSDNLI